MKQQYEIEMLSPVHIGNGNAYSGLDSIFTDDYFYAIDINQLFKKLQETEKIDEVTHKIGLGISLSKIILPFIEPEKVKRYSIKLSSQNKEDIRFMREIYEFIKDANERVYIPGSEIKGTIRTAILYLLLLDNRNYEQLRNDLRNVKKDSKVVDAATKGARWAKKKISKKLTIITSNIEAKLLRGKRNDAKYDLLKFVQVSDSSVHDPAKLKILHTISYRTRGKHSYVEAVPQGTKFDGTLNILKDSKFLKELGLEDRGFLLSKDKLLESCYKFSRDLISHESDFYTQQHNFQLAKFYQKLKNENTKTEPLIRIGQGQGFLSTTISLCVKNRDPELYEIIRIGTRGRSYSTDFPKTRKIVLENGKPAYPMGWVIIRMRD